MRKTLLLFAQLLGLQLAAAQPNLVVILADDQGWGDLSFHGNEDLATPRLDSLAQQGASFDRFFSCPVCAPTRAEFLTGRFAARTGVRGVTRGEERLNLDELTIAEVFQRAGYATALFGKWHNGTQPPYHPNSRGFEEFYGFTSGHHGHYFDSELEHNDRIVKGDGFIVDDLTSRTISYLRKPREKPFFCFLSYPTPHSPMQVPDEFWERHKDSRPLTGRNGQRTDSNHHRAALAMVENIDWNVGRLLDALDDLEVADETIIVYFSDNGPNGHRWNGGMRGIKGSVYDGGTRSPLFIRWPERIAPGTKVARNAAAIDLLPTLTALAGIRFEPAKPIDGRDLSPLLLGGELDWDRRMLFVLHGDPRRGRWGVREGRYRYYHDGELHHISEDPGQRDDIADSHPERATRMRKAGEKFLREVEPMLVRPDPRPFHVGIEETTHLPARDGRGHAGVERSSRHPNSSFFTNWTKKDQRMTWEIEVDRPGRYEVFLHYTCPDEDAGSRVGISFGEHSTSAVIAQGFDPPLLGAARDRSPRSESYYKEFKALSLGTIELPAENGTLVLEADTVTGGMIADVRRLVLVRQPSASGAAAEQR